MTNGQDAPTPGMPSLSGPNFAANLLLGLLLPVLLVAIGLWLDGEYARMRSTGNAVEQVSARHVHALDLLGSLRKAETAQRGFVITRNPAFLDRYEPSRVVVLRDLDVLGKQYAGGLQAAGRVSRLRKLIAEKFEEMDGVSQMVRAGQQARAVERVSLGRGQILMDRIEAQLQTIIAEDAARLERGTTSYWQRTQRSRHLIWMLIVVISVLLLVGSLLLWRSKLARWRGAVAEADASARHRAILDSTSDAIVILNPSGTIETVNAAARSVLGYEPSELSRRDVSVVLDIADGDGSFHERIGLSQGRLRRTLFVDRNARTKDGRMVPVDVALGLMTVPDGLHIVASVRDISDRREIERLKDDFIATVSHELRTPLTSVVGSLGLLRAGAAGPLPEAAAQLVKIAESNSRRLIRLTNDILDLEKFGSGQMSLEFATTELVGILEQAVAECESSARAKSVAILIHAAERLPIKADRARLLQVAANLLSNAVRHTPEGSTLTVAAQVEQGRIVARISDEGDGVPEDYRERIFDRFVQAPASTQSAGGAGGTGLGLAIAREIMQRHGGSIWVEPAMYGGACFAFALPLHSDEDSFGEPDREDATPAASIPMHHAERQRPTILQIDDDVDLVQVVAASLADEARVIRANGLASARAILELEQPDLVLLDIGLPDGSGLDILPLLVDRAGEPLPTIVFSAQDSPGELDGNVHAVLTKSRSSMATLRETVRRIFAGRAVS